MTTRQKTFYTQNGWQGSNYDPDNYMPTKSISDIIRKEVKEKFPGCKFSVTTESYSGGSSINVTLMKADFDVLKKPNIEDSARVRGYYGEPEERLKGWEYEYNKGHIQLNQYYLNDDYQLTEKGKEMFGYLNNLINSYRYDDSDGQIDYFNTNFYYNLSVGKWDKPFVKTN